MKHFSLLLALYCAAALSAAAQFNATITVTELGSGAPLENATVQLDGNSLVTDATGQVVFTGLVDGTYEYSATMPCYNSALGSVTIAGADGSSSLELGPSTANNVFFFIGSPFALLGATVQITDGANYNHSFVTWDTWGGEMVADVPYGEYTYTISKPCYGTVTGTMTVDCNNGEGVAVFAEPAELAANNVFFFIGSPFALIGATVQITDGADYNHSFVTWDTWGGEMVADVPYGEYTYTISKPCYGTVTGTMTVDCNNGEGVAVFAEPSELVLDATVTLDGSVLNAAAVGVTYQWVDCDNANAPIDGAVEQSFAPTVNGNYAVIITTGDCSATSECTAVTVTGTDDIESHDVIVAYPNPFSDLLMVRTGASGPVRVELINADGRLALNESHSGKELISVWTDRLPSGSYVLRLTTDKASTVLTVVK